MSRSNASRLPQDSDMQRLKESSACNHAEKSLNAGKNRRQCQAKRVVHERLLRPAASATPPARGDVFALDIQFAVSKSSQGPTLDRQSMIAGEKVEGVGTGVELGRVRDESRQDRVLQGL